MSRDLFRLATSSTAGRIALVLGLVVVAGGPAPQRPTPPQPPSSAAGAASSRPTRVEAGAGRRVLVRSNSTSPVVGKVHCEIDDSMWVMLPDGALDEFRTRDVTPTDRPFVPFTKEELAERLASGRFKDFKTRISKGSHFVFVYNSSDTFFAGTSRILETMYPGLFAICKRQGLNVHEPEVPLVVIMFRTRDEFNAYQRMPDGVVAYYDGISNQVLMYEQSRLSEVMPEIAVKQAISTVAHEGVHQVLQNIGVQQRLSRWPMWLSEGLAEYFAPTELGKAVRWKGVGMVNDMRMKELELYIRATSNRIRNGDTVRATVKANNLTSTGYASAWSLTHYLGQRRQKDFYEYVKEVSELGPLERYTDEGSEALFKRHFGDDYAELETSLAKHLLGLPYTDPFKRS